MTFQAIQKTDSYQKIEDQGKSYFEFPTGLSGNQNHFKILSTFQQKPGYYVHENQIEEWKFTRFIEKDAEIKLHGPYVEALTLEKTMDFPFGEALPYLQKLMTALITLQENHHIFFDFQTDLILFPKKGGVLFLPVEIIKHIHGSKVGGHRIQTYASINHRNLDADLKSSFSFAALLYKSITGIFPFSSESEADIQTKIDLDYAIPPELLVPEIKSAISQDLLSLLLLPHAASFSKCQKWFKEWSESGFFKELSSEEKQAKLAATKKKITALHKKYQRQLFWKKHKRLMAFLAIGASLSVGIFYFVFSTVTKPRLTHGFAPWRVVETFYQSVNTMDFQAMEDSTLGEAGKVDIGETAHMHILYRVRQAYNPTSVLMIADQWEKEGKPELSPGQGLYGISNFKREAEPTQSEPYFIVSYERWRPEQTQKDSSANPTLTNRVLHITDKVYLTQDNEDWVISKIERVVD